MFRKILEKFTKAVTGTAKVFKQGFSGIISGFTRVDENLIEKVEEVLIGSDIGVVFSSEIVEELRELNRKKRIKSVADSIAFIRQKFTGLLATMNYELKTAANSLTVYLFVGVNGTGKTTSIGKLACRLRSSENKKVIIAGCDTFRAAAIEQINTWSERAGVDILFQQRGSDPASVCYDALDKAVNKSYDYVLIDTAGRLQTKENLMRELAKLSSVIKKKVADAPHEVLLTIDATTGQNAINQVREFKSFSNLTGIVLTKLDGTAKGGIIFAIAKEFQIPVKLVGTGESIDDIEQFDKDAFVSSIFEGI